ncbi:MAG: histidinol-phosphate transaminase [Sideroxydans sp.]|nr:histidinol-phosphate transaminase [Sideroxydans sp.]
MSSLPALINQLVRPEILALNAYHVPASAGMVKLDAMENPYLVPAALRAEIAAAVSEAAINRYPDPSAQGLRQKIRDLLQLSDDMDVLLGNGSDELIQLLAMAVNKPNATLLSVEPSFVMYKMIATFLGMRYVGVPLAADFSLDMSAMLASIEREQPALIFLAYPNNPTGNAFSTADIQQILCAAQGLVVVDEAYYAFAENSFVAHLTDYPNLLVMRTFSKLGMAGLRLGFLVGDKRWLAQLDKLRLPYNVGVLPQLVASKLLQHHDVLLTQAAQIKQDRSKLAQQLSAITGVQVFASSANFLLLRVAHAQEIFAGLKQRGVLIKNLHGGHAMLENCLRVTVGTPAENERFIVAFKESIQQG